MRLDPEDAELPTLGTVRLLKPAYSDRYDLDSDYVVEIQGLGGYGLALAEGEVTLARVQRELLNRYRVYNEGVKREYSEPEVLGHTRGEAVYDRQRKVISYDLTLLGLQGQLAVGWVDPSHLYDLLGPSEWKGEVDGHQVHLDLSQHVNGCELHEVVGWEIHSPFLATRERADELASKCGSVGYWQRLLTSDHPVAVKFRELCIRRGVSGVRVVSWPQVGSLEKAPERLLADALHLESTAWYKFGIRVDFAKALDLANAPQLNRRRTAWVLAAHAVAGTSRRDCGCPDCRSGNSADTLTYRQAREVLVEYLSMREWDYSGHLVTRYNPTPTTARSGNSAHRSVSVSEAPWWGGPGLGSEHRTWGWLVKRGEWTYHSPAATALEAIREAVTAAKHQRDEARRAEREEARLRGEFNLPTDRSVLVSREDSYAVGNCQSGTEGFASRVGLARRQFVGLHELLPYYSDHYVSRVVRHMLRREGLL